jgi:hypothetical protein
VCILAGLSVWTEPVWAEETNPQLAEIRRDWTPGAASAVEEVYAELGLVCPEELLSGGSVRVRHDQPVRPVLIPSRIGIAQAEAVIERLNPTIGLEIAVLVPASAFDVPVGSAWASRFLRFSQMEGIEYYSDTRDEVLTLFTDSYTLDGPDGRRVPDITLPPAPTSADLHFYQRDTSFGRNRYEGEIVVDDEGVYAGITNLTRTGFGLLPGTPPGSVYLQYVVRAAGEAVLIHGLALADVPTLLGLGDRVRESFANRVIALVWWAIYGD